MHPDPVMRKSDEHPRTPSVLELKLEVKGRVQGVGFRIFVQEKAQELNIQGWVKNLENRNVEVLAQGEKKSLDELLDHLRQGPAFSRVDFIDQQWLRLGNRYTGFRING